MTKFVFMRLTAKYQIQDIVKFKDQLLSWASNFDKTVVLSGENKPSHGIYLQYNYILQQVYSGFLNLFLNKQNKPISKLLLLILKKLNIYYF